MEDTCNSSIQFVYYVCVCDLEVSALITSCPLKLFLYLLPDTNVQFPNSMASVLTLIIYTTNGLFKDKIFSDILLCFYTFYVRKVLHYMRLLLIMTMNENLGISLHRLMVSIPGLITC